MCVVYATVKVLSCLFCLVWPPVSLWSSIQNKSKKYGQENSVHFVTFFSLLICLSLVWVYFFILEFVEMAKGISFLEYKEWDYNVRVEFLSVNLFITCLGFLFILEICWNGKGWVPSLNVKSSSAFCRVEFMPSYLMCTFKDGFFISWNVPLKLPAANYGLSLSDSGVSTSYSVGLCMIKWEFFFLFSFGCFK